MADIYLARQRSGHESRLVVLKEVLASLAQDERLKQMLVEEALLARQLDHPNIARVELLGSHEGVPFIAMEYVEGLDLNQLLGGCARRGINLPMAVRLAVIVGVLHALDYAHSAPDARGGRLGIVHRDVSPSNILLSFDGAIKLCDFGIALAASAAADGAAVVGKAGYMSPEHARGWKLDGRADVFAAGIVCWELLAGRRMYREKDAAARMALATRGIAPELPRLSLPEEYRLRAIVERALQEDPARRFQAAGEMRDALKQYIVDNGYGLAAEQLGEWLRLHFEDERIARRRARQRALQALEMGPAVVLTPVKGLGEVVRESGTRLTAAARATAPANDDASGPPNGEMTPSIQALAPLPIPQWLAPPAAPEVALTPDEEVRERLRRAVMDARATLRTSRLAVRLTATHRRVVPPAPESKLRRVGRVVARGFFATVAILVLLACLSVGAGTLFF